MFRLEIDTHNAAFDDGAASEVARILRQVAKRIEAGELEGEPWDVNGNRVGAFELNSRRREA
ncbi:hypothetical protein [Phenylobacterium sp.]|uniref:hypothetical protein n=1 Tax=Phenylobacterium sp. TaxID=1871053 RepID=UPI002DED2BA2|nr:hypothetical protein [Phenylobacterium sp.]